MNYQIKNRYDRKVLFEGEYGSLKLCVEAAVKIQANLMSANLRGANLGGAENYAQSHEVFAQLVIQATIKFTVHEQEMAFRICALRLCWTSIHKEYGKKLVPVFKKLAKLGYGEFLEAWKVVKQ